VPRSTLAEFQARRYKAQGNWCVILADDRELASETIEALVAQNISPDKLDFARETLSGDGLDAGQLIRSAQTPPLIGESKIIIVAEAGKMKQEEQETLLGLLDRVWPGCLVVLEAARNEGRLLPALVKAIAARGTVVEAEGLDQKSAVRMCLEQAERCGAKMKERAAAKLVETVGADLGRLRQEVDKLSAYAGYSGVIDEAAVQKLTSPSPHETIFDLISAAFSGNASRATALLRQLLELSGETPERIVGMLGRQVRLLWEAKRLVEAARSANTNAPAQTATTEEWRRGPGARDWQARRLKDMARELSWDDLREALEIILRWDLARKGIEGEAPSQLFCLEMAVLELCSLRKGRTLGYARGRPTEPRGHPEPVEGRTR
jgi:DNA polymerase-3 subunit delta